MKIERFASIIFNLAGIYDGFLGAAFLTAPAALFTFFEVTPPNHFGYVRFPGALLIIFAAMFFAVARNPRANRNLIPYSIWFKVAYSGVVFGYWFTEGLPGMWKPFAVFDVAFAIVFFVIWKRLAPPREDH